MNAFATIFSASARRAGDGRDISHNHRRAKSNRKNHKQTICKCSTENRLITYVVKMVQLSNSINKQQTKTYGTSPRQRQKQNAPLTST